jgi:hypothetical protein
MKNLELTALIFGVFASLTALMAAFFMAMPLLDGGTKLNQRLAANNYESVAEAVLAAENIEGLKTVCLSLVQNEDRSISANRRIGEFVQMIVGKGMLLVLLLKLKNIQRLTKLD